MSLAVVPTIGRIEGGASEASLVIVMMGLGSAPIPPAGEAQCEEPVVPRVNIESSWASASVVLGPSWGSPWTKWMDPQAPKGAPFALDDPAQEEEWKGVRSQMGDVADAMMALLYKFQQTADPCRV